MIDLKSFERVIAPLKITRSKEAVSLEPKKNRRFEPLRIVEFLDFRSIFYLLEISFLEASSKVKG